MRVSVEGPVTKTVLEPGTAGTGIDQPAGGAGFLGFLSGVYQKLVSLLATGVKVTDGTHTADITAAGEIKVNLAVESVTATNVTIRDATDADRKATVGADGDLRVSLYGRTVQVPQSGTATNAPSQVPFVIEQLAFLVNDGSVDAQFSFDGGATWFTLKPGEVLNDQAVKATTLNHKTASGSAAWRALGWR